MLMIVGGLSGCAYYNTFYNARRNYNEAVAELEKSSDQNISVTVRRKLDAAIAKSNKVLAEYPTSQYRDDALFIIALSNYHKGNFQSARRSFEEFILNYPSSNLLPEVRIWYGRTLWKMNEKELSRHVLRTAVNQTKDEVLVCEALLTMADLAEKQSQTDSALVYLEMVTRRGRNLPIAAQAQFRIAAILLSKGDTDAAVENLKKVNRFSPSPQLIDQMQVLLARIYRQSGNHEEALDLVMQKLNDSANERIWPALGIELALIYEAQENYAAAQSRYTNITETYPKSAESAEAYYRLALLSMRIDHDYAKAQNQLAQVTKEFNKSQYIEDARLKSEEIKRFFSVRKNLTSGETIVREIKSALVRRDTLAQSLDRLESAQELKKAVETQSRAQRKTVDTLKVFEDYYRNNYELAELYHFNFLQYDSARYYYHRIADEPFLNPLVAKSLYALYYLHDQLAQPSVARHYKQLLAESFPDSPYLLFIENREIKPEPEEFEADRSYQQIESRFFTQTVVAITQLHEIVAQFPRTTVAERSQFAIAWLYYHHLLDADSARSSYRRFQQRFPDSRFKEAVVTALQEIDNTLALLAPAADEAPDTDGDSLNNEQSNPEIPATQSSSKTNLPKSQPQTPQPKSEENPKPVKSEPLQTKPSDNPGKLD